MAAWSELAGRASARPACSGVVRGRRRVFSLRFQAGESVLFIHWRVAAERRGVAGDFLFYGTREALAAAAELSGRLANTQIWAPTSAGQGFLPEKG